MSKAEKHKRPTIIDVAKAAGVAPSTVSHAINNKGYVDTHTKEKILKIVRKLGYRPNLRARGLRTGGARTIALISAMPLGVAGGASKLGFLMELAAVAAEEAMSRGLALVLVPPQPSGTALPPLEIDGALLVEPTENDPNLIHLMDAGLPVVSLGRCPGHDDIPCVDLWPGETAKILLAHLSEVGSSRIALVIGDKARSSYLAAETIYKTYCRDHGQQPLIYKLNEGGGETAGQVCAAELLRHHPEVDGILALVDAFAVGCLRAADGLGLKVPEQLKVATRYDGLRAKLCSPPLTALDLHLGEVATLGVELLARQLAEPEPGAILWPSKPALVIRASTKQ